MTGYTLWILKTAGYGDELHLNKVVFKTTQAQAKAFAKWPALVEQ